MGKGAFFTSSTVEGETLFETKLQPCNFRVHATSVIFILDLRGEDKGEDTVVAFTKLLCLMVKRPIQANEPGNNDRSFADLTSPLISRLASSGTVFSFLQEAIRRKISKRFNGEVSLD